MDSFFSLLEILWTPQILIAKYIQVGVINILLFSTNVDNWAVIISGFFKKNFVF